MNGLKITENNLQSINWDADYFKCCEFEGFSLDGATIEADFGCCGFRDIDLYWTIFLISTFVDCEFDNCIFRGVGFGGCKFVECSFRNCQFIQDNLGGDCGFGDATAYNCKISNCVGFDAKKING
jgi:uncharacterized protein YjbI with pentapeptide repeats